MKSPARKSNKSFSTTTTPTTSSSNNNKYVSNNDVKNIDYIHEEEPDIGMITAILTYFSYALLLSFGWIRDLFGAITGWTRYSEVKPPKGYGVLLKSWESFFTRRLYHRIQDCWGRPICSSPSANIEVMLRESTDGHYSFHTTGNTKKCINVGSYNYLGFADDWINSCGERVFNSVSKWPNSMCSSRMDGGNTILHEELEDIVAKFVGKEKAVVYSMGYGTNTSTIATLMGSGCLLVSDSLNHTSIINGARASPAFIRVFKHNDVNNLENVLKESIINGQPKHHRPWKKILVMVEGIYSMEGSICKLAEIVKICKKYKAYIYVDEAHSIGALGSNGKGVCEYTGVNPDEIDILMGTFTKSFSGMGGYIAASKEIINYMKSVSPGLLYHNSLSPIVTQQIITAFKIIQGDIGNDMGRLKLDHLKNNSNYFRNEMIKLGLHVYGDWDTPIIPVMIYFPSKLAEFSRQCLERGLAVVIVGFPATSVVLSRARFCISAGHTKEQLDEAIRIIADVGTLVGLKYKRNQLGY